MSPEAKALAQALLDHHRQVCRPDKQATIESCLITYGALCERAEVAHLKAVAGRYLREVAQWCHENGWPPLNALAVNQETRKPGHGYDGAPDCSLARWPDQAAACASFEDYPDAVS